MTPTQYFRRSSREIKRLDGISRSPVFSLLTASVQGLEVIRASRAGPRFSQRFRALTDENSKAQFAFYVASRWLGIRLDALSAGVTLCGAMFGISAKSDGFSPSMMGLVLSYALQIATLFQVSIASLGVG